MRLSIIIPVYNVEKYLDHCINSIIEQSFKDLEIILVNDGSTDKSGKICDKWVGMHENIKVIHQENAGLSAARNIGLQSAIGEYILFIDSDDFISRNSLAFLFNNHLKDKVIDVTFLEAIKLYPDGREEPMKDGYNAHYINDQPKQIVMKHLASLSKFPGSACTKLVSRKLLIENNLFFDENIVSEDIDWTIRLIKAAETFSYCPYPYYYYRQNRIGSITFTPDEENLKSLCSIVERHSSKNSQDYYQKEINSFLAYEFIIILYFYANLSTDNKSYLRWLKDYSWIMEFGLSTKQRLVNIALKVFGTRFTAKLLKIYKQLDKK